VALIAVAAVLAVLTATTMQFRYQTNVDYASATNARDAMRAHYLARSVMNMSMLITKVQHDILDKLRNNATMRTMFPDIQISDFMSMLEVPMCGSKSELGDMASMMGVDAGGIKGLGIDYGQCHVESFTAEDGKINVNCANGQPATAQSIGLALTGLVSSPAYNKLFEERDGDGQFTDRQMFVKALMDYVDRDESGFGVSGSSEDYGYESLKEPYRAKNYYIDSPDELQLVRGMDDRKWEIFGPQLTVYGGCKINVSAVTSPIQMMTLFVQAAKNPNDPVIANPAKLYLLAQRVAAARSLGKYFSDLQKFVDFVKDPDADLGLTQATQATQAGGAQTAAPPGLPPVEGLELDMTKLGQIAKAGARRVYRIVASAQVGRVEKRIIGVWDTENPNQNVRDPAYRRGAWLYWREE